MSILPLAANCTTDSKDKNNSSAAHNTNSNSTTLTPKFTDKMLPIAIGTSSTISNSDLRFRSNPINPTTTTNSSDRERNGDAEDNKYSKITTRAEPESEYELDSIDEILDSVFRYDSQTTFMILLFTMAAFATRFWNIWKGNFVIWDEAHFGKFASYYLKRKFYFDVHPPMGKMLVALGGLLANYRGGFGFESGTAYPEDLNYTGMRVFLACFGALMVPLAFMTGVEVGMSRKAATVAALMVLFDTAYLAISRYILLDSMLLFFTVSTVYCLTVFHNQRSRPFSASWWFWLVLTGASIGMVSSVKWVGLFVTALVGFYTIDDLWAKFGDLKMSLRLFAKHFLARVLGLILIPFAIYAFSFYLHFGILVNSGPGDAQMSSLFQAQLAGNNFHESPVYVAYGSRVSIKNNGYGGGLLHSHIQAYPAGSKQQQVTCYHHKDTNNEWIIARVRNDKTNDSALEQPQFLKHGDIVRLKHLQTGRNLHSHPIAAPVSKLSHEVSCYGNETIGDSNDHWRVEIVKQIAGSDPDDTRLRSLSTQFRLRHVNLRCLLRSHGVNLPEWGFKQHEVVCDKYNKTDSHNLWNVEQHWNAKLPAGSPELYPTNFWDDFIHLNVGMWSSNNAMVPDPNKEDFLASVPKQWPLAEVGLRMCSWDDKRFKVYLLGNPIVWWSGTGALVLFCVFVGVYVLRFRRGVDNWTPGQWDKFLFQGKTFMAGWILHFLPFLIMGRVMYVHHYFPALYFAIMMAACMIDHVADLLPRRIGPVCHVALGAAVAIVFHMFSPLAFGFEGPSSDYAHLKWRSSWTMTN